MATKQQPSEILKPISNKSHIVDMNNNSNCVHMYQNKSLSHNYTAITNHCLDTGMYFGFIKGFPGAHSQGETLDELNTNLQEVISMLNDDNVPVFIDNNEYVDSQTLGLM